MDYLTLNQTTPPGYSYLDNPRPEHRGGGIAVIYQHNLNLRPISIPATTTFEHLVFRLSGPRLLRELGCCSGARGPPPLAAPRPHPEITFPGGAGKPLPSSL
uniref:Uncharacterized protein n=1 Tax=Knipowitschia caucasica TaxID=637954 RepID=A0AAV2MGB8_KNICA